MRIAIISDIHSNLEALKTVLKYIENEKISRIICLGDVVGYGPRPNECVDLVREKCERTLLGNHDSASLDETDINFFNEYARQAILWTRKRLNQETKEFLRSLPYTYPEGNTLYVHSSPVEPEEWHYVLSVGEAKYSLNQIKYSLVFIGHSHVAVTFTLEQGKLDESNFLLSPKDRYIVNVGSVGQPRDGDPRASFVIFDTQERRIQYIRLEYNVRKTFEEIMEQDIPPLLAHRLLNGR